MTRVTYDADPGVTPERGDFLRTKRGILRVIVGARQVRSRVAGNRWALEVAHWGGDLPECARALPLSWYPRGRRR
jgi:hypothetical protein